MQVFLLDTIVCGFALIATTVLTILLLPYMYNSVQLLLFWLCPAFFWYLSLRQVLRNYDN